MSDIFYLIDKKIFIEFLQGRALDPLKKYPKNCVKILRFCRVFFKIKWGICYPLTPPQPQFLNRIFFQKMQKLWQKRLGNGRQKRKKRAKKNDKI